LQPPEKRNQSVQTGEEVQPGFNHGMIMAYNGMKGTNMIDLGGPAAPGERDSDCRTVSEITHADSFRKRSLQG